jgi:hypothetical protein
MTLSTKLLGREIFRLAMLKKILNRCCFKNVPAERPLRWHLIILALGTLLPMIAVAVLTTTFLAQRERARFKQGAVDQTKALLSACDTELASSIRVLSALANSSNLDNENLASFY